MFGALERHIKPLLAGLCIQSADWTLSVYSAGHLIEPPLCLAYRLSWQEFLTNNHKMLFWGKHEGDESSGSLLDGPCGLAVETGLKSAYWFSVWIIAGALLRGRMIRWQWFAAPRCQGTAPAFKCGLSCCPKWCVALRFERLAGRSTCCWLRPP